MPKVQKKSSDFENPLDGIETLLKETIFFKELVQKNLQVEPGNYAGHRVHCTYLGRILEIQKTMLQAHSQDPETLLVSTLKCVVLTLMEKGESQAAESVGRHLEAMGEKVKEQWLEYKKPGKAIMKSERSLNRRSPPSGKARPNKRKSASDAL